MSRDGLLPKTFSNVHPKFHTPWKCNLVFMFFVSLFSGLVPIAKLGNMTSIGTLLAFVLVCAGIIIMRKTHPELKRPYRTPFVPLVPILGIVVCLGMMVALDVETWIRLVVWLVIGFVIYFGYSRTHSNLVRNPNLRRQVTTLTTTALPGVELLNRGKVRDIYRVSHDRLLFIATDRISAFDCILPDGIPDKGRVLTQMSLFWFDFLRDVVPNHLVTADVNRLSRITSTPFVGNWKGVPCW